MAESEVEIRPLEEKKEEFPEFIDEEESEPTSPVLNPLPSVESFRKDLYWYYIQVFLFIPIAFIPAVIVFIKAGRISFDLKLVKAIILRETFPIISQGSTVLAFTILIWALANIASILVPYLQLKYRKKLSASSYKRLCCLLAIRKNIKFSLFYFGMLFLMAKLVYDTTLLDKILEVISKRVEGKQAEVGGAEKKIVSTDMQALFYIERVHVCVIVFSFIISFVRYLLAAAQFALHKAPRMRIEKANGNLKKLSQLFNKVVSSNLKITFEMEDPTQDESMSLLKITSVHFRSIKQAQVIGKMIFNAIAKKKPPPIPEIEEEQDAASAALPEMTLDINDIEGFSEIERKELFDILKGDNQDKFALTKQQVSESIGSFYEERQNITKSMRSNAFLLKKLSRILLTMGIVIAALLCTPFLDVGVTTAWAGFLGLFSALSFASQSLARTCFDSMIFIFVMHNFDIGDRLIIDGDTLIAEFIEIFTCHFSKLDQKGGKTLLYIPSSSLFSKTITNISRAKRREKNAESLKDK
jgi:hypothetical protein